MAEHSSKATAFDLIMSVGVGSFFLAAAGSKAWRMVAFIKVMAWLVPPAFQSTWLPFALALLVVGWEASIGILLISGRASRRGLLATGCTVIVFSGVLVVMLVQGGGPGCGCLGFGGSSPSAEAIRGLVRNAGLVVILMWLWKQAFSAAPVPRPSTQPVASEGSRAFTLIELLVCILVVGILISLAIPALRESRKAGARTRDASNMRQVEIGVSLYAGAYREAFPYLQSPGSPTTPAILDGVPLSNTSCFGAGAGFWANLVVPQFSPGLENAVQPDREAAERANESDGYPRHFLRSSIRMTFTAFARPEYWQPDADDSREASYTGTKTSDVAFPSNKGLHVNIATIVVATDAAPKATVAFADGAARAVSWEWTPEQVVQRPHGAGTTPWIVMATRDGLRGRDFP